MKEDGAVDLLSPPKLEVVNSQGKAEEAPSVLPPTITVDWIADKQGVNVRWEEGAFLNLEFVSACLKLAVDAVEKLIAANRHVQTVMAIRQQEAQQAQDANLLRQLGRQQTKH